MPSPTTSTRSAGTSTQRRTRSTWENTEEHIHVLGRGVIRFHAVYWLAMLIAAGLPLPTQELVHGYITVSGNKIFKSLGNSVDATEFVREYGCDAMRYYLLAEFTPPTATGTSASSGSCPATTTTSPTGSATS